MKLAKFSRFFLIEPNLKKSYGHVVEFPFALQNYLKKKDKQVYIICNKGIDNKLLSHFENTYPFISQGCFEILEDKGNSFANDLSELNKKFDFTNKDLIITLTSYINQIYGITTFLQNHIPKKAPLFCVWFHQLYPPTNDFNETLSLRFKQKIHEGLRKSFKAINGLNNVFIFTTVSGKLQKIYSNLSLRSTGSLPLPYSYMPLGKNQSRNKHFTLGFLGDGRYEKGLSIILSYIIDSKDTDNYFILENIFPRGFSKPAYIKLSELEGKIKKDHNNVCFIKKPLSNSQYKAWFDKIDIFLMPYHPQSYNKRVSGVFIEAVIKSKPIIASNNTWMAEQIKLFNNGVIFDYNSGTNGLRNAILKLTNKYEYFSDNAIKASKQYRKIHSPGNFVKNLFDFIN